MTRQLEPALSARLLSAARTLHADTVTAEVVAALAGRGIQNLLLKGPTLNDWRGPGAGRRVYADTDLLVPAERLCDAEECLSALGFRRLLKPRDMLGATPAVLWVREADGANVDLHQSITGPGVGPGAVWRALVRDAETLLVAGEPVRKPGAAARALHVALHAAQHGPRCAQPKQDLANALAALDEGIWRAARDLAEQLEALEAFAAGLRLLPEGRALAATLDVPTGASTRTALLAAGALSFGWEELMRTQGLWPRLQLVLRELVPSPAFMWLWSPLARRGRLGLSVAYLWRPVWLAAHLPRAVVSWQRRRRAAGK